MARRIIFQYYFQLITMVITLASELDLEAYKYVSEFLEVNEQCKRIPLSEGCL